MLTQPAFRRLEQLTVTGIDLMQDELKIDKATAEYRHVFVVGCGRSGTTWLRLLLAQHSKVATTDETRLFSSYMNSLDEIWRRDQKRMDSTGLRRVLSEETFVAYCADFANKILANIISNNPQAEVIVEKTPVHALYGPLILKLIPDAMFLHIVRDPRSVVSSLRAASRSFGRQWAPKSVAAGTWMWRESVDSARSIRQLTDRYKEVHYEDMLSGKGVTELDGIFKWMGLRSDAALCERIVEDCAIENLRKSGSRVKENRTRQENRTVFFRKGRADSWREELSKGDIRIIEYIACELMRECGYELSSQPGSLRKPMRLRLYQVLDGLEWRSEKVLKKVVESARSFT